MRVLYAAPNLPYPPTSGGAQRTHLLLSELKRVAQVDVVFLPASTPSAELLVENKRIVPGGMVIQSTDEIRNKQGEPFGKIFPQPMQTFLVAERQKWRPYQPLVKELGSLDNYDLVVSRYLSSACMLDLFRHPKLIIDIDDYDPDRLRLRVQHAGFLKSLTLKRCLTLSQKAHHDLISKATHCWVSNPNDREHRDLEHATVLPNIPMINETLGARPLPPAGNSRCFAMIATFSYSANINGADAFIESAWPRVIKEFPDARLRLIGRGIPNRLCAKWSRVQGVEIPGFVENLENEYARCLATVCPVQSGGGTNIKVLESAAYGRPAILTPFSYNGFEAHFSPGSDCFLSESVEAMAVHCLLLLKNPKLGAQVGSRAAETIEQHYNIHVFREAFERGLSKLARRNT